MDLPATDEITASAAMAATADAAPVVPAKVICQAVLGTTLCRTAKTAKFSQPVWNATFRVPYNGEPYIEFEVYDDLSNLVAWKALGLGPLQPTPIQFNSANASKIPLQKATTETSENSSLSDSIVAGRQRFESALESALESESDDGHSLQDAPCQGSSAKLEAPKTFQIDPGDSHRLAAAVVEDEHVSPSDRTISTVPEDNSTSRDLATHETMTIEMEPKGQLIAKVTITEHLELRIDVIEGQFDFLPSHLDREKLLLSIESAFGAVTITPNRISGAGAINWETLVCLPHFTTEEIIKFSITFDQTCENEGDSKDSNAYAVFLDVSGIRDRRTYTLTLPVHPDSPCGMDNTTEEPGILSLHPSIRSHVTNFIKVKIRAVTPTRSADIASLGTATTENTTQGRTVQEVLGLLRDEAEKVKLVTVSALKQSQTTLDAIVNSMATAGCTPDKTRNIELRLGSIVAAMREQSHKAGVAADSSSETTELDDAFGCLLQTRISARRAMLNAATISRSAITIFRIIGMSIRKRCLYYSKISEFCRTLLHDDVRWLIGEHGSASAAYNESNESGTAVFSPKTRAVRKARLALLENAMDSVEELRKRTVKIHDEQLNLHTNIGSKAAFLNRANIFPEDAAQLVQVLLDDAQALRRLTTLQLGTTRQIHLLVKSTKQRRKEEQSRKKMKYEVKASERRQAIENKRAEEEKRRRGCDFRERRFQEDRERLRLCFYHGGHSTPYSFAESLPEVTREERALWKSQEKQHSNDTANCSKSPGNSNRRYSLVGGRSPIAATLQFLVTAPVNLLDETDQFATSPHDKSSNGKVMDSASPEVPVPLNKPEPSHEVDSSSPGSGSPLEANIDGLFADEVSHIYELLTGDRTGDVELSKSNWLDALCTERLTDESKNELSSDESDPKRDAGYFPRSFSLVNSPVNRPRSMPRPASYEQQMVQQSPRSPSAVRFLEKSTHRSLKSTVPTADVFAFSSERTTDDTTSEESPPSSARQKAVIRQGSCLGLCKRCSGVQRA